MTNQVIPYPAVEAALLALRQPDHWLLLDDEAKVRDLLEAAAPYMRQVVTSYDELDALPVETVIRTGFGTVREKNSLGYWYAMGDEDANGIETCSFPAVVLYRP